MSSIIYISNNHEEPFIIITTWNHINQLGIHKNPKYEKA